MFPSVWRNAIAVKSKYPLAIATQQAVEFVGLPEARIPRTHAIAYMRRAKKSREAYEALGAATEEIENEQTARVPERLKNKQFPVLRHPNIPTLLLSKVAGCC